MGSGILLMICAVIALANAGIPVDFAAFGKYCGYHQTGGAKLPAGPALDH